MKIKLLLALTGSILIFATGFRSETDDWEKAFGKIDAEVRQHSRVFQTLKSATEQIGHRLTGSTQGSKAEEYAFNLLKSYGFNDVKYQPFEVVSWSRDTVTLSIVPKSSDNFREVAVVSLAHSPVSANLNSEIVDVGNGLEEDFESVKHKLKGKVALANIGLVDAPGKKNLHRSEKTALAIKYGAGGIIMVNQAPGKILLTGTASVTGALINIPAVCISNDSGRELRSWITDEGPLEAHINMRNYSKPIKARNVIATLRGKSDERVIVGGHLDSWDLATGAIDNGIGSFSVLDMARTFKALKVKPERTVQFVMFMGEEQGLLGSKFMVKELVRTGEITKVSYMMNLDMTNDPKGANGFGREDMDDFFKKIGSTIKKVDPLYENKYTNRAGLHSDHQPFMLEGVPVAGLSGSLAPSVLQCYHADCDRMDLVDKQQLENTVRIASMYLYALSNARKIPAKRLNSVQTRDFLTTQGLKQELILGQDWRWN